MKIRKQVLAGVIGIYATIFAVASCSSDEDVLSFGWLEEGEQFSGGNTTVYDVSANAFGNAAPNLQGDRDLQFVTGNSFFNRNWITAPASTAELDGLGPLFIARSCSSCHFKDGRGNAPMPGEEPVALLFRLSVPGKTATGAPQPDPHYGGQLGTHAVLGMQPEATVQITYEETGGQYADGQSFSLRKPAYMFENLNYGAMAANAEVSPRVAQHMVGLGLLEAISEATLESYADPDDQNNDGISGKINRVWNVITNQDDIGRFGWKASQPNVRQQIAAAFVEDIGITSSMFPHEGYMPGQGGEKFPSGGSPELEESILDRMSVYAAGLAVPRRRDWDTPEVLRGKQLFNEANCTSCHVAKTVTGTHPDFPEFSNQTIYPYTDLLLHDMGEGLADHRPDFLADGQEWRTPPLWGIGLIETVNGHTNFLHDGRARNLEEAILWHGGEAEQAKQTFVQMKATDREALIKFLRSL